MPQSTLFSRASLCRWAATLAYTVFIFASLPFFPDIWNYLTGKFPAGLPWFSSLFIPAVFAVFWVTCIFICRRHSLVFYFGVALITSAFFLLVQFYCEYAAERLHLAEYVLLAVLAYRAFSVRFNSIAVYLLAFLYCGVVGYCDEMIQGILPNRVYELKDLGINWASSLLGISLVFGFTWRQHLKPKWVSLVRKAAPAACVLMLAGQGLFFYRAYVKPPLNVILITIDTCRPDFFGFSGHSPANTPRIDRLAKQGVVFTNVISAAPWTSPAMISLFTGLYSSAHGVSARGRSLPESVTTVFDVFMKHGYRVPSISYLTSIQNFTNLGLEPREDRYFSTADSPGDELINWIRDHRFETFFVWYHYRFLHLPYTGSQAEISPQDLSKETPALQSIMREAVIPRGSARFTPEEQQRVRHLYSDQYKRLDGFVNRLTDLMNRWKLTRKTLLVLTADHGEELFEHGFVGHASTAIHATLFDEVLKIPLIMVCPSRLQAGRFFSGQVRQIDIMPTLLDVAGLPVPEGLQGVSLLPLIDGKQDLRIPPAISESNRGGYQSSPAQETIHLRAIRNDDWKLVRSTQDNQTEYFLYDLRNDPAESQNVFERAPEMAQQLSEQLTDALADSQSRPLSQLSAQTVHFSATDIPADAVLERPVVHRPLNGQVIQVDKDSRLGLEWSGDPNLMYVIEYDVGTGWRNLKGKIPVRGTARVFGPLPSEAWTPLPYWNPYRFRVAPFGLQEYWSDWIEFSLEDR